MSAVDSVEVLVIQQVPNQVLSRIANVDRRIKVIDARGWFDGELRATWPQWTVDRYLGNRKYPATTLDQRNQALASAEVMLVGWPPVKDIRARAPRLKWVHELPAGASNFLGTDLWGSSIIVTTSRGLTNRRPMAEYVLASFLHFARGIHLSYRDQTAAPSRSSHLRSDHYPRQDRLHRRRRRDWPGSRQALCGGRDARGRHAAGHCRAICDHCRTDLRAWNLPMLCTIFCARASSLRFVVRGPSETHHLIGRGRLCGDETGHGRGQYRARRNHR